MSVAEGGAFAPYSSSSGGGGGGDGGSGRGGGGSGGGGSAIPPGVPAHEKLYRDFTRYKKKRERRRQDFSVERRRKCTFEPTLFTRHGAIKFHHLFRYFKFYDFHQHRHAFLGSRHSIVR